MERYSEDYPQVHRIWHHYPNLARHIVEEHKATGLTASGHDADHDLEVGQLAYMVAWPKDQNDAVLAGVAGLMHSTDRILEAKLNLEKRTISEAPEEEVSASVRWMLTNFTDIRDKERMDRIVEAVINHGSKPNQSEDDLITIAVADADRLANMGATLPIRSGQHNHNVRLLNPETIEVDPTDRSPREKYNNPDSVLWDIQNCANWYLDGNNPYSLRLDKSLELGRIRAERLVGMIQAIKDERALVGLYPYPYPVDDFYPYRGAPLHYIIPPASF